MVKTYSLKRRNMSSARVIASRLIALVAVPLALTYLFLGYLLKPGYAGFLDNGGYALTISQYLMVAKGPWSFWFGPSMLPMELIYAAFPDAIGAWKASIFFYQYASFLSAYAATRVLKGAILREDHRWLEPALYAISLAYSFNVWIIGGFANYFLFQFEMPQVVAPLFVAYFLAFILDLEQPPRRTVKRLLILGAIGVFMSSSPPMIVSVGLLMAFATLFRLLSARGIRDALKIASLFVASIAISFLYFIVDYALATMGYFGRSGSASLVPAGKDYFWGPGLLSALTDSYGQISFNSKWSQLLPQNIVIPSSLAIYLPFSLAFYLGIFYVISRGSAVAKRMALALVASDLVFVLFLNGFHAGNAISSLLYFLANYLPSSLLYAFQDALPDLASLFPLLFVGVCVALLVAAEELSSRGFTRKKAMALVTLAIAISVPIMGNYGYVQLHAYSKVINPTPIPSYYADVFAFIKDHENSTYAWYPVFGIPAWRGCALSNTPGYLGGLYGVSFNYLPVYESWEIVNSLSQSNVPLSLISKYHVKYVVIDDGFVGNGDEAVSSGALKFLSNCSDFRLVARYGQVYIYEFVNASGG